MCRLTKVIASVAGDGPSLAIVPPSVIASWREQAEGYLCSSFWLPNDAPGSKREVDFIHSYTLESGARLPPAVHSEMRADVAGPVEVSSADAERQERTDKATYKVEYNFLITSNNGTIAETYGKMFSKTVEVQVVGPKGGTKRKRKAIEWLIALPLVLVDEPHEFKRKGSKFFNTLQRFQEKAPDKHPTKFLHLTATPLTGASLRYYLDIISYFILKPS